MGSRRGVLIDLQASGYRVSLVLQLASIETIIPFSLAITSFAALAPGAEPLACWETLVWLEKVTVGFVLTASLGNLLGHKQLPPISAAFYSTCARISKQQGSIGREFILSFLLALTGNENSTKMSISVQDQEFPMEQKKRISFINQDSHTE